MKTIEQLKRLSNNPSYTLTEYEQRRLDAANQPETAGYDVSKKSVKGNAPVKEIGKLNKNIGDPKVG